MSSTTVYTQEQDDSLVSFLTMSLVFFAFVVLVIFMCFLSHKAHSNVKFYVNSVATLRKKLEAAKSLPDSEEKLAKIAGIVEAMQVLTSSHDFYIDAYEGLVSPLTDNTLVKKGEDIAFHNPIGRSCMIAGNQVMASYVNLTSYAVGGIITHAVVEVVDRFTDFKAEGLIVAAIAGNIVFFAIVMLQSMQHQCFQEKLNGDFNVIEKDAGL